MTNLENKTKKDCKYYNWGGEGTEERPSYPTSYGARCELTKEIFSIGNNKILNPNCYSCKSYINKKEVKKE